MQLMHCVGCRVHRATARLQLSHMHSDHVGGFSLFVQGLWLEQRQHALPVHMPGGGVPAMKAWLEATILPEELIGFPIHWEPLTPAVKIRAGDVSVNCALSFSASPTISVIISRNGFQYGGIVFMKLNMFDTPT